MASSRGTNAKIFECHNINSLHAISQKFEDKLEGGKPQIILVNV